MTTGAGLSWRDCGLCRVPIASSDCSHVEHVDGRIVMSEAAWESLVSELSESRNREAEHDE